MPTHPSRQGLSLRCVSMLCALLGVASIASCGRGRSPELGASLSAPPPALATTEGHDASVDSAPVPPLREVVLVPRGDSLECGANAAWIGGSDVLFVWESGALVMPGEQFQERPWAPGREREPYYPLSCLSRRLVRDGNAVWVLGDRAFWKATWDGHRIVWDRHPSESLTRWLDSAEARTQAGDAPTSWMRLDWCVRDAMPVPLPPLPRRLDRDRYVSSLSEHGLFRGLHNATRELRETRTVRVERVDETGRVLWRRDVPKGLGDTPETLYGAPDGSVAALVPGGVSFNPAFPPVFVGEDFVQKAKDWLGPELSFGIIADPGGGVAWTADGDAIFHTGFKGVDEKREWSWHGLVRWSRLTRRITALPWAKGGDTPAVSPDGRTLAFEGVGGDGPELVLADLVGAPEVEPTEVLTPPARRGPAGES